MVPIICAVGAAALLVRVLKSQDNQQQSTKYRLFISHSWLLSSSEYNKFVSKLKYEKDFYNHSIPKDKAFSTWDPDELRAIFRQQMAGCQKVFILAHNNLKASSYVKMELEIAAEMKKEIIAIRPYGLKKVPLFVKQCATQIIANNISSISKVL